MDRYILIHIYIYRSDSGTRERRAVSSLDKASRRIGGMKARSTSFWERESRKPMRRRESRCAELKSSLSRARSAPNSREWSRFKLESTSFLQQHNSTVVSDSSSIFCLLASFPASSLICRYELIRWWIKNTQIPTAPFPNTFHVLPLFFYFLLLGNLFFEVNLFSLFDVLTPFFTSWRLHRLFYGKYVHTYICCVSEKGFIYKFINIKNIFFIKKRY